MKGTNLGEFEELLLLIVLILQDEAYVNKIKEEVFDQINRNASMGALHSTLSRLEKKTLLDSKLTGSTTERWQKKTSLSTHKGKTSFETSREQRDMLWNQVPNYALNFQNV